MSDRVIVIVGCGPAGASAALTIAQAGLQVLVIERKPRIGIPVQCGELAPKLLLHELGLGHESIVQEIEGMYTHLPSGEIHYLSSPGLMIDRIAFETELITAAIVAGAHLWTSSTATSWDGERLTVRRRQQSVVFSPFVVIGADGPRSLIRESIGLAPQPLLTAGQETVVLAQPRRRTRVFFSPRFRHGYGWFFPRGTLAHVGVGGDFNDRSELAEALRQMKSQLEPEFILPESTVASTVGSIPVGGASRQMVSGRALVIGDAAGYAHPITGAGIATAVLGGRMAGQAVIAAAKCGDLSELQQYNDACRTRWGSEWDLALLRRRQMIAGWDDLDRIVKECWVTFPGYYHQAQRGQE